MSGEIESLVSALDKGKVGLKLPIEPGEAANVLIPGSWVAYGVDGEYLLDQPRRAKAEVKVRSAGGFIEAVKRRIGGDTPGSEVTLYSDDAHQQLVCILNDDADGFAGWRDHRVVLDVRKTEEWQHWKGSQGLKSQEVFAEAIEYGQAEITDPPPAQMLRIAETFEATVGITFRKGASVRDGAQQYVYEENIDAKAAGGTVEIPEGFTITVAPFIGGPRYVVKARLKTRLASGKLSIGYTLERPEETERAAFRDIATKVGEDLGLTAIEGVAPPQR